MPEIVLFFLNAIVKKMPRKKAKKNKDKHPLIDVRDLKKSYVSSEGVATHALRGLSFFINQGEFVALMGPSGSGKSTLLHIIGFLDQPTGGEYLFDGKTFTNYTPNERAHIRNQRIGFIFQTFNLLARTNVLENVKLPLLYSTVPEAEWNDLALKAIKDVGLDHRLDHDPSQLSGGEKQRVAIARALVNNPDVILADEPTGNLDSKTGQSIMEILQDLHETRGHTILLITHETFTAEHAQRIIRLHDGKLDKDTLIKKRRRARDGGFIK